MKKHYAILIFISALLMQVCTAQEIEQPESSLTLIPEVGIGRAGWRGNNFTERMTMATFAVSAIQVLPHKVKNFVSLRLNGQYNMGVATSDAQLKTMTNAMGERPTVHSISQANHQVWSTELQLGYTVVGKQIDIIPYIGLSYRQWIRKPNVVDNPMVATYDSRYKLLQSGLGLTVSGRINATHRLFISTMGQLPFSVTEKRNRRRTSDDFATLRQQYIDGTFPKKPEYIAAVDPVINNIRNGSSNIQLKNNLNWSVAGGLVLNHTQISVKYEQLSLVPQDNWVLNADQLANFRSRSVNLSVGYIF